MANRILIGAIGALCFVESAVCAEGELSVADRWAGRRSHPAVVNPPCPAGDGSVLSLRGDWEFAAGRHAIEARDNLFYTGTNFHRRIGLDKTGGLTWANSVMVKVPGCWEASGVGEAGVGFGYRQEPTDVRLRHRHLGNGWYRKTVVVPADWKGRRIWLKEGGVRNWAWFWIDNRPVAHVTDNHGTLKWDVSDLVTPGKPATVVVQVDNTYPSRNSQMIHGHRWGGLVRDVELEATADVFIDDAWVRGDFDNRLAHVKVAVEGEGGRRSDNLLLRATIEEEIAEVPLSTSTSSLHLEVSLRRFRPWSPEHPNLYTAKVELVSADGKVLQARFERFGVRKLEVRGKEFYLNDKPFFFRGFGDDSAYPLTGFSPADRAYHLNHLRKARAAGFNYVRTHTHCELPEYFEAADEAGVIVQPECSYNDDESSEEVFTFDPVGDLERIMRNYRRHPSLGIYSGGNEGTLGPAAGPAFYRYAKEHDPDRLVVEQDGGTYTCGHLASTSDFAGGPMAPWERGSFNPRAFICHEYMNLCVKGDAADAAKYTGVWAPRFTSEQRCDNLRAAGLGKAWGDRLQLGQHALQAYWQKYGLEHARKDPYCDGYCFWTIADVNHWDAAGNAPCAQGFLNAFWETKRGGNTLADFAEFNSPSVLLIDTEDRERRAIEDSNPLLCCYHVYALRIEETNRVYEAGSEMPVEFMLAHYGEDDLPAGELAWRFEALDGRVLLKGTQAVGAQAVGPVRTLAKRRLRVPAVAKPTKARLTVSLGAVANHWDFWFVPPSSTPVIPGNVVVAAPGSAEAAAARAAGKNLLLYVKPNDFMNIMPNWWSLAWGNFDMAGVATVQHPVLGDFPLEPSLTPQLFRIFRTGVAMPVEGFGEEDAVMITEGISNFYLNLAAKTRPDGGREVFVSGLDVFAELPEARMLRKGILDFLASPFAEAPKVSARPKIKVACIGDSITWGYAMTNRTVECYPAQLQRLLGDGYEVRNFGVPGAGAYAELKKGEYSHDVPWRSKSLSDEAYAFEPDIVISAFGANDSAYWMWEYLPGPDGRTRLPTGLFCQDYLSLLRGFEKNGRKPRYLLWTRLAPLGKSHRSYGKPNFFLMERDLESVADAVGAEKLDMYTPLLPYCETADYAKDGIHPEGGAQRIIAETTARQILSGEH